MDEFPHTVTFQEYTSTPDGGGGNAKTWSDFLTTEAHVQPIKSSEYASAQQLTNPINHNIYYPYQEGVKGGMKAVWVDRGKTLELRSAPLDQGGMGEILAVKAELK
jgi:SPP1 family predicted phage head-tail adaptor